MAAHFDVHCTVKEVTLVYPERLDPGCKVTLADLLSEAGITLGPSDLVLDLDAKRFFSLSDIGQCSPISEQGTMFYVFRYE